MDYITENVGKKIKLIRVMENLTQEALAEKIKLTAKSVGLIERGKSFITSNTLIALCETFNKSPRFFFDFSQYSQSVEKEGIIKDINLQLQELNIEDLIKIQNVFRAIIS